MIQSETSTKKGLQKALESVAAPIGAAQPKPKTRSGSVGNSITESLENGGQ